jgi:hypothetical protein
MKNVTDMHNLVYIGSPQFDGIGLLNTEAQKLQQHGSVTILDGIIPGAYPEIKNFSHADYYLWTLIRRRQFLSTLKSNGLRYIKIRSLLSRKEPGGYQVVHELLEQATTDHCVCNNLEGQQAADYKQQNWTRHYTFLCRTYDALHALFETQDFSQATLFNGRNTLAKLIATVSHEKSIPVRWLEYFGKRNGRMTYISSPVDFFDFDAMSDHILEKYRDCTDVEKNRIAEDCLNDRMKLGDPILAKWGLELSWSSPIQKNDEKPIVAFFFSSEDEYPAVKTSIYGFSPPTEQYHKFNQICEAIAAAGLHHEYRFLIKLHPRYVVEQKKLELAQRYWDSVIKNANKIGLKLEVIPPLASPYNVIKKAAIVFSYGTTSWEATFLGKPAVLMGPNLFATHGCTHIASSVSDVIDYLKHFPEPKPRHSCYPYAWAWRELGHHPQSYAPRHKSIWGCRIGGAFFNRFSKLDHAE